MMINKRIACSIMAAAMLLTMTACTQSNTSDANSSSSQSSVVGSSSSTDTLTSVDENVAKLKRVYTYSDERFKELENLYTGAFIPEGSVEVKMTTSMGEISLRLFPQYAPKAVENFVTHARDGYYEGTTFHRIIKDFMVQGGDPKGDGTGGESIWKAPFEDEFSDYLYHFRGAISMANSGTNSNGSQFFIVQAGTETIQVDNASSTAFGITYNKELQRRQAEIDAAILEGKKTEEEMNALVDKYNKEMMAIYEAGTTAEMVEDNMPVFEQYLRVGGAPHLDGKHTVFGYVTKGMEIIDQMAAVAVNGDSPLEKITVEKVEVV